MVHREELGQLRQVLPAGGAQIIEIAAGEEGQRLRAKSRSGFWTRPRKCSWSAGSTGRASTRSPWRRTPASRRSTPAFPARRLCFTPWSRRRFGTLAPRRADGDGAVVGSAPEDAGDRADRAGAGLGRDWPRPGRGRGVAPVSGPRDQRRTDGARAGKRDDRAAPQRTRPVRRDGGAARVRAREPRGDGAPFHGNDRPADPHARAVRRKVFEALRAETDPHVSESLAFFLAACRASGRLAKAPPPGRG